MKGSIIVRYIRTVISLVWLVGERWQGINLDGTVWKWKMSFGWLEK